MEQEIRSKKELAVRLSKLKGFSSPKVRVEQYSTDSEIAADILWQAGLMGDLQGTVADLGAGTGILGIGALLLGASFVYFVESEDSALAALKENLNNSGFLYELGTRKIVVKKDKDMKGNEKCTSEICPTDITEFSEKADTVIMNPPFGTKEQHADRAFLEKAFSIAPVVYSLHKTSTSRFVEAMAHDHEYRITLRKDISLPLKGTMSFHKKRIQRIDVTLFRMESLHRP